MLGDYLTRNPSRGALGIIGELVPITSKGIRAPQILGRLFHHTVDSWYTKTIRHTRQLYERIKCAARMEVQQLFPPPRFFSLCWRTFSSSMLRSLQTPWTSSLQRLSSNSTMTLCWDSEPPVHPGSNCSSQRNIQLYSTLEDTMLFTMAGDCCKRVIVHGLTPPTIPLQQGSECCPAQSADFVLSAGVQRWHLRDNLPAMCVLKPKPRTRHKCVCVHGSVIFPDATQEANTFKNLVAVTFWIDSQRLGYLTQHSQLSSQESVVAQSSVIHTPPTLLPTFHHLSSPRNVPPLDSQTAGWGRCLVPFW